MKKHFLNLSFGLFTLIVVALTGCQSSATKIGQCHLRDERFVCQGTLQATGQGELKFSKVPPNEVFQLTKFSLDKVDDNGDSMDYKNCSGTTGEVTTARDFKFNCQKLEPGTYYVKFKLEHQMPKNYKPRKSESCLLVKQNMRTTWQCTTSGEFKYIIQ